MQLTLLLTISILAAHLKRISFFNLFHSVAALLHKNCLLSLPVEAKSLPELKALVCGANFSEAQTSNLYIATGLIHLFVVSGAHLILIKKILDFIFAFLKLEKIGSWLCAFILIYFSASCAFNAPVTRALLSFLLADDFIFKKNFWPQHFRIFVVGLLTLLFNSLWISSLSLQLSWLIALGLYLNRNYFSQRHLLFQQIINMSLIYPTLLFLQVPQPIIALLHLVFSAFLELILFPLALLVRFFHFLAPLFDLLILLLKNILIKTEVSYQLQTAETPPTLVIFNWGLIFVIHFTIHIFHLKKEREKLCFTEKLTG